MSVPTAARNVQSGKTCPDARAHCLPDPAQTPPALPLTKRRALSAKRSVANRRPEDHRFSMVVVDSSKTAWLCALAMGLSTGGGLSSTIAAEAPVVAVNSNHWPVWYHGLNGPFETDVYGFNADGTSFTGWSGSYGALIGPANFLPIPGQHDALSRAEGIVDVSYANGSLYIANFLMGSGGLYQVNPKTGLPTAAINISTRWATVVDRSFGSIPWVPTPITQIPGYAGFLAGDIDWSGSLRWSGVLSAPKAGPEGALYLGWTGWWEGTLSINGSPGEHYGNHYTANPFPTEILRYTGDPLHPQPGDWTTLIPDLPSFAYDLLPTPDHRLLVNTSGSILAYDALSGQFLDTLVLPGAGGLNNPQGLALGNGDTLFVASQGTDPILRFDSRTGAFLGPLSLLNFQLMSDPLDLDFLDGARDTLLVSQRQSPYLVRISNVNGPGPATATPFTPAFATLFGPEERSMSIAIIPETPSGPVLAAGLAAAVAAVCHRRRHPSAGSARRR